MLAGGVGMRIRIIQLLLLILAVPAWAEPLYFVQITDTHLMAPNEWERTRKAIESINRLPFEVSCVVVTGDIFSENFKNASAVARAKALFRQIKAPCYVLPGNHDIPPGNQMAASIWQDAFGPLFQAATYGGVGFAMLYSDPLAVDESALPFKPLEDLKAYLKKDPKRPTLVFTHNPSVLDFRMNTFSSGWPAKSMKAWMQALGMGNVQAVITGHFHRGELHWLGKIPLFVCPAIASRWQRQSGYRIYCYENGRVSYYSVYI
jgi:3',5'-cyclic AMP phosphodiesterase CpdA